MQLGRAAGLSILLALLTPASSLSATLTGTVSLGRPPIRVQAHVSHDRTVCGVDAPIFEQITEVDAAAHLKDALVFVESATGAPPLPALKQAKLSKPGTAAEIEFDQQNCAFLPRVAAARVGAKLLLKNSDPVLHNVHIYREGGKQTVVNFAMPIQGQQIHAGNLSKAGSYILRCDAGHTWMNATLWVFQHSFFAVTGANGAYTLEHLPKGRYRVVAWHPDLGRIERPVELKADGDAATVNLRF